MLRDLYIQLISFILSKNLVSWDLRKEHNLYIHAMIQTTLIILQYHPYRMAQPGQNHVWLCNHIFRVLFGKARILPYRQADTSFGLTYRRWEQTLATWKYPKTASLEFLVFLIFPEIENG